MFAERISYFRSENERIKEENERGEKKIAENQSLLKSKKDYSLSCNKQIDELSKKSAEISKDIAKLSAEITKGEDLAESVQNQVIKSVESLADINKNLGALTSEKSVITTQQKAIVEKVNSLVDKYTVLSVENENNKTELKNTEEFIETTKSSIKDREESISSTNAYLSNVDNKIYALKTKLTGEETSLRLYSGLKDSFEGYSHAVKKLMNASRTDGELNKRIKGVVASIISTEKAYETAIETAIGGALQNIVTDNPTDAEYVINYLKRTDGGRVTILPVTSVKPRLNAQDTTLALKDKGALGLATELVKYDSYFESIVSHLLGNTLICDTLENATVIARKNKFSFRIVTLDGDVLSQSGSMSGGSKRKNDANLLGVDRQVQELQEAINKDNKELVILQNNKTNLLSQVNAEVELLNKENSALLEAKQKAVTLREKISSADKVLAETQVEIEKNKDDIAVISNRLSEISMAYTDIEAGNEKINKEKETASKEQSEHREMFQELRKKRDEVLKENTEVQAKLSALRSEISATESEIERLTAEISAIEDTFSKNAQTTESNLKIIDGLTKKAEQVALSAEDKKVLEDLRRQQAEFDKKKEKLNELIAQDNLKRDVLQADIDKNTEKRANEEVNYTKVDTELDFMSQNLFTEYQLTYETCVPLRDDNYDISTSHQEITSLKRKIAALGSINPNAIEEYNELNESYNELVSQRDDLYKAQDDLQKVIDDLTKEMTLTFNEGFKTIRSNFSKIFKELFGGGSADLIVEESTTGDPLDAGIEIVAEPPGKKLQKISLLSGGEMSLTAIAILFAILRLRPMPFCVLDEIEAALDDANVARFAKYLKNFSKETQFICITHKKVTMENADGLFGVTMPEKGVSSIVSVKLSDAIDMEGIKN